jgi:hypothetical protein
LRFAARFGDVHSTDDDQANEGGGMTQCTSCKSQHVRSIVVWLPFRPRRQNEGRVARAAQEHHCTDCRLQWSAYYGPFGLIR